MNNETKAILRYELKRSGERWDIATYQRDELKVKLAQLNSDIEQLEIVIREIKEDLGESYDQNLSAITYRTRP